MKSFTSKIILVQWSLQSSKTPPGPAPVQDSPVPRWTVALQLGSVASNDPSCDLLSPCPLCLLSLPRGWSPCCAVCYALSQRTIASSMTFWQMLMVCPPTSLPLQLGVDLCERLPASSLWSKDPVWFPCWTQPAYECHDEREEIRSSPLDWPSPESGDGAQGSGVASNWSPPAPILASPS